MDSSTNKVVSRRDVVCNKTDFFFLNEKDASISPELLNKSENETTVNQKCHHKD